MIGRLNHVAIAVESVEKAAAVYKNALGAKISKPESLAEHGVKVIFVELPNTKIELLEPFGENSPISGFVAKNPAGGIHQNIKPALLGGDLLYAFMALRAQPTPRATGKKPPSITNDSRQWRKMATVRAPSWLRRGLTLPSANVSF